MTKGKAVLISVSVRRYQAFTFTGKSVGKVYMEDDNLCVSKKRARGTKFDIHRFHRDRIIGFSEGEGGKESRVYATVMCESIVRHIEGKGIIEGDFVRIIDEFGISHTFNMKNPECSIEVIELDEEGDPDEDIVEEPKHIRRTPVKIPVSVKERVPATRGRPSSVASDWDVPRRK